MNKHQSPEDTITQTKEKEKVLFSSNKRPITYYNPSLSFANKAKHCLYGSEENKYLQIKVLLFLADMSAMKANG